MSLKNLLRLPSAPCQCARGPSTYLATVIVSLFDSARLQVLPEALAECSSLVDPTIVARALMAQIKTVTDVADNMPTNTHTTASDFFRLA